MKHLLTILLALAFAAPIHAQVKVLEASAKKAPAWIGTAVDSYIIAAVEAPSIAEARTRAEQDIAAQMAMSVARNVDAAYANESSEVTTNAGIDSRDSYSSSVAVQAANLPFIKGISLTKADEIYWAKVRDKASGREYYQFYVKYPFFRSEHAALVAEFEQYDAAKEAELSALEEGLDTVDSLDGIKAAIGSLDALQAYFFDKVRAAKVRSVAAQYRGLTKNLSMAGAFSDHGTLVVSFSLAGRPFKVFGPLKASSNCATDLQVTPVDGVYHVTFSSEYCLDDEDNAIEINARVDGRKFAGRYAIKH